MTGRPQDARSGTRRSAFARAGRRTNVALRWLLIAAFVTGWVAFATARGVPAVLGAGVHGLFAISLLVLTPWKYAIVRRARTIRPMSWVLLTLALICFGSGFLQLFAGYVVVFGLSPIQLHVGSALVGVVALIWHVVRHRRQRLRRIDLARRRLLQTGVGLVGAGAGVVLLTGAAQLTGGTARRPAATGSRPIDPGRPGGAAPDAIPATIWLLDRVPDIDADEHRITLPGRSIGVAELDLDRGAAGSQPGSTAPAAGTPTRPGVVTRWPTCCACPRPIPPVSSATPTIGSEQSLVVRSVTGYTRTFPLAAADRLWLAVACQGQPLSAGNGGPVRLVAPGRRGFWWVKWVGSVEVSRPPELAAARRSRCLPLRT